MEQSSHDDVHEHVINIQQGDTASMSTSYQDLQSDSDELHHEDRPSTSTQTPSSQSSALSSPTAYNSRNVSFSRRDSNYGHGRSPFNSGLWISVELVIYVAQIVVAAVVLIFSRHEHPRAPLFAWLIGYTVGCIATLPLIYWRYVHHNRPSSEQEPEQAPTTYPILTSSQQTEGRDRRGTGPILRLGCNITVTCPRLSVLVYHFKMAVDCFFAVWFVVGNVWIFGGHSSSSDAPNLYRLCLVFLTLSCIGYAIPFIMCATICCCFPCIISVLRIHEDLGHSRGATQELINELPTYKFKPKRSKNWGTDNASSSENVAEGGILGPGTKKERVVSAEDAVCCICLAKYLDDDELRELPCTHFFHVQCVDKWLKINAVCPLCKSEIGGVVRSLFGLHFGRRRLGDRIAARDVATSRFTV